MGMQVLVWGVIETHRQSISEDANAIRSFAFDRLFPNAFQGPLDGYRTATIPFGISLRDRDGVVDEFCLRFEQLLGGINAIIASIDFWFEESGQTCRVRYVCREAQIPITTNRTRRWQKSVTLVKEIDESEDLRL